MNKIVTPLLEFKNQLKMYHWTTTVDSKHKNSDKLIGEMDELIDEFVEVLSGSRDKKPSFVVKLELKKMTDAGILKYLEKFRVWLSDDLTSLLKEHETDLMNLKDEMIGAINRGLYLLRNA